MSSTTNTNKLYFKNKEWYKEFLPERTFDVSYQKWKLKAFGVGMICGFLYGHGYAIFRGFFNMKTYSRVILTSTAMGMTFTIPVISMPNITSNETPIRHSIITGIVWGGFIGYLKKGPKYVLPFGMIGISLYLFMIGMYFQVVKPIYYYHYLEWPEYDPPIWWPIQPTHGLDIFDALVEKERLNVIYPEDLNYDRDQQKQEQKCVKIAKQIQDIKQKLDNQKIIIDELKSLDQSMMT